MTCEHDFETVPGLTGFTVGDWPFGLCEHLSIPHAFERCTHCGLERLKPSVDAELKKADAEAKEASGRYGESVRGWRNPPLLTLLKADNGESLPKRKVGLWRRLFGGGS